MDKKLASYEEEKQFANPKAPKHIQVPEFTVPPTGKAITADKDSQKFAMTPRSVTASMRAFSSVVMTPKNPSTTSEQSRTAVPRIKSSNHKVVTVTGAKQSAPDKKLFDAGEQYVDRAAERRGLSRQHSAGIVEAGAEDMRKDIRLSLASPAHEMKSPHSQDANVISYRTKVAENVCIELGLDPLRPKQVMNKVDSMIPGRMTYVYDLSVNGEAGPQVVTRSILCRPNPKESNDLIDIIGTLLSREKRPKLELATSADVLNDIFEDAGEYKFESRERNTPPLLKSQLEFNTKESGPTIVELVPESLNKLLGKSSINPFANTTLEDDYLECYPDTGEALLDYDEDDTSATTIDTETRVTKRQKRQKETRKLDKQLHKVTKIIDKINQTKQNRGIE